MINILMTNFNNEPYIKRCLDSVLFQEQRDWRCYVTDDLSTDNSVEIIEKMTKNDDRFTLVKNVDKMYQLGNYHNIITNFGIEDGDVCVSIDGDDWLPDRNVFDRVLAAYEDGATWITFGSMLSVSGHRTYNPTLEQVFWSNDVPFHLRTWKVFLWKQLCVNDLLDKNGRFFQTGGDLAFMFLMLKIAGKKHSKFLESLNYCYNDINPLCNHFLRKDEQIANDLFIRSYRIKKFSKLYL